VASSSGHAAQFMAISTIAGTGDNIVSTSYLYGGVSDSPTCVCFNISSQLMCILGSRPTTNSRVEHVIPKAVSRLTSDIVFLKKYGIGVKFVTSDDPAAFAAAIDGKTKAIYVESIANPKYYVSPIRDIAKVCNPLYLVRSTDRFKRNEGCTRAQHPVDR
jgi:O-acetylhomoserine/O-acetylserine sulfhydrylase